MKDIDLLIVGPSKRETGGVSQYIRQQSKSLPDSVNSEKFDTGGIGETSPIGLIHSLINSILRLFTFLSRSPPDVVHVHTADGIPFFRNAAYVLVASKLWNIPVVLHVHGSGFDKFISTGSSVSGMVQSLVYKNSDKIIVLSEYWETVFEQEGVRDGVTVLPNGIRTEDFESKADSTEGTMVIISDLIPRKGIEELLESVSDLEEDFTLHIAGKGPLSDVVADHAQANENIHYHGFVTEEEKVSLLSSASVYVLPTYAEGLPIGILEAMAAQNAVVSTTVGSIPEVVSDSNGVLIDPVEVDELREAIQELLEDPETVSEMAQNNKEMVEGEYSWSSISSSLTEMYKSLVVDR